MYNSDESVITGMDIHPIVKKMTVKKVKKRLKKRKKKLDKRRNI
jgi:hypothetical protein